MADEPNIDPKKAKELANETKAAVDQLKEYSKEATDAGNNLASLADQMRKIASGSRDFGSELKAATNLTSQVSKTSKDIAQFTKEGLKSQKDTEKLLKKQKVVKGQIQAIESQIAVLMEKAATASSEEAENIYKTVENLSSASYEAERILKTFENIEDINEDLNKKTKFFDTLAEISEDIPVVGKLLGDFRKGADAARQAGAEGAGALKAGLGGITKAAGKASLAFGFGLAIKGIKQANENITSLSRNLNMSRERANELNQRFNRVALSSKAFAGKDLMKATMTISEDMGITAKLSDDTAVAVATMTKKLGLSAEQASNLTKFSAASGKELKDFNNDLIGQVKIQNDINGVSIRYQDVMKDVASASAATQLTSTKFSGGIAKAAYQARKLGLSFSQLNAAGDALLDFESSIAAEMEAELLLGRDLNLDKARMAALTGDQATLAAELAKNVGTSAEFSKMNVLQQNALAKSMGMSRDELAQTLINQEALAKFSDVEGATLDDKVKNEYARIEAMKDGKAKAEAMAKLQEKVGENETLRQLKNKSLVEAQQLAAQRMTEAFGKLGDILDPISKFMESFSQNATNSVGAVFKLGSKFKAFGSFLMDSFKPLTEAGAKAMKGFGKFGKFLKGPFIKAAGGGGLKTVLKKIPILGALVGAGLAYKRAKEGDWLGAGGELLSGLASIFPGIGTGVSMAIDAALIAGDMKGVTGKNSKAVQKKQAENAKVVETEDFVIKPLSKDTITMAGGTKLGGNVEALLQELIGLVRTGGNVYLDGSKVGETLVLNSKLSN